MDILGRVTLLNNDAIDSTTGLAIAPKATDLAIGQVAVNYSAQDACLFIKDNAGNIIKFTTEAKIAQTLSDILGESAADLNTLKELLTIFAGADNDVLTLIKNIQTELGTKASAATLNNHIASTSNPHGVTAEQVKALPLTGGTMEGNVIWKTGTGTTSIFPSHIYRNEYNSNGDVFDYYGVSGSNGVKDTFANLRVFAKGGTYRELRFGGDGTLTWSGYKMYHYGNANNSTTAWNASTLNLFGSDLIVALNGNTTGEKRDFVLRNSSTEGNNFIELWSPTQKSFYIPNKVGIGVPNPTEALEVTGNIKATSLLTGEIKPNGSNQTVLKELATSNERILYLANNTHGASIKSVGSALALCYNGNVEGVRLNHNGLGIGTSNPTRTLDVVGNAAISGKVYTKSSIVNNVASPSIGGWARGYIWTKSDGATEIGGLSMLGNNENPDYINLAYGNYQSTSGLRIMPNGNTGIGTSDINSRLTIGYTAYSNPLVLGSLKGQFAIERYRGYDDGKSDRYGAYFYLNEDTGKFSIQTGYGKLKDAEATDSGHSLLLNPSGGNVGIGTPTPMTDYKLEVNGNVGVSNLYLKNGSINDISQIWGTTGDVNHVLTLGRSNVNEVNWVEVGGIWRFKHDASGATTGITFNKGSIESRGYVSAGGSISSGGSITATGEVIAYKAATALQEGTPTGSVIVYDGLDSTSPDVALSANMGNTLNTNLIATRTLANNAAKTATWSSITGTPDAFTPCEHNHYDSVYPSDRRLKHNIETIEKGLNYVLSMNPVKYVWSAEAISKFNLKEPKAYGLIAQELELLLPECTTKIDGDTLGVDYIKIIPFLIAAIKDLDAKLAVTNQKINTMTKAQNRAYSASYTNEKEIGLLKEQIALQSEQINQLMNKLN